MRGGLAAFCNSFSRRCRAQQLRATVQRLQKREASLVQMVADVEAQRNEAVSRSTQQTSSLIHLEARSAALSDALRLQSPRLGVTSPSKPHGHDAVVELRSRLHVEETRRADLELQCERLQRALQASQRDVSRRRRGVAVCRCCSPCRRVRQLRHPVIDTRAVALASSSLALYRVADVAPAVRSGELTAAGVGLGAGSRTG
jgi:hypothetical protein